MSYYSEIKKVNKFIDEQIEIILKGGELSINGLILEATAKYEIGEKVIIKRLERIRQLLPQIKELDGTLYIENEKKWLL